MKTIITILVTFSFIRGDFIYSQILSIKPYGVKSGIIEYSYSGKKTGNGILYFDNYGMKSAWFSNAIENGEKRKSATVIHGDYKYMWNPDKPGEGMKLQNPFNDFIRINVFGHGS
jgi:hypothetical protein